MSNQEELGRYLASFDTTPLPHITTDVLVIGSGVAGLIAAVVASRQGRVLIVSKNKLSESNTMYAQGGIAAVLAQNDSFESHIRDTLDAGQGLCKPEVVEEVVKEGPRGVEELMNLGTCFDRENGKLALTVEGGHSRPRIIHGKGDSTGMVIGEALLSFIKKCPNIDTLEHYFAIDLLTADGTCCGAVAWHRHRGKTVIWAKEIILATGGCGQVYRETTNSEVATGDGIAMAYRAGATVRDLEFMQFHPTTLYIAGAARSLATEALRGEGATLINKEGERFMPKYHPKAELAPRDVVSRCIAHEMQTTGYTHVYLDIRHIPKDRVKTRFPRIWSICASFHIDISKEALPVRPSAHYMIGGVKVDEKGRTDIKRLYACGETASTGLHGANRLGSNSLLECLVYGHKVGNEIAAALKENKHGIKTHHLQVNVKARRQRELNLGDIRYALKSLTWRDVGLERNGQHLRDAIGEIEHWSEYIMDKEFHSPYGWELQNMLLLSKLIAQSARERKETRGVHYRSDFPDRNDDLWKRHIITRIGAPGLLLEPAHQQGDVVPAKAKGV
ncbi:MAG: L-aspartate oxidase [Planctomycetes bacterium]|nr:L-aspartate oxidase [Planctomycetota bacterium]